VTEELRHVGGRHAGLLEPGSGLVPEVGELEVVGPSGLADGYAERGTVFWSPSARTKLQRHGRLEPTIVCEVDDNHAAGAKFLDDLGEVWPITYPLNR
jgi:hypothetical protein